MRTQAQTLGARAEELVARHLGATGWTILGRNIRVGRAEIDILAQDPGTSDRGRPELVAVEVRWRNRRDFGYPEETVNHAKIARLRAAVLTLRNRNLDDARPMAPRRLVPGSPGCRPAGPGAAGGRPAAAWPGAPGTSAPGLRVPPLPVRVDVVAVEGAGRMRHHRAVG